MDSFIKKNVLFFLFFLFSVSIINAQKEVNPLEIPQFVLKTYADMYPSMEVKKWYEKNSNYWAKVERDGIKGTVKINGGGSWIATEWEMDVKDMPSKIKDHLKLQYPKLSVSRMILETRMQPNYVIFLFDKKEKTTKTVFYTTTGDFIRELDVVYE